MTRRLVIATTNPGKVREVAAYLAAIPDLEILSLRDLPPIPEVPEEGTTFRENAVKKAVEYSRLLRTTVVADDSGICVEALGGSPGVGSARYGGPGLDDPGRVRFLLDRIAGVPDERRGAAFECVLALASRGALVATFEGRVEGRLLREPRGENGFGYDPIFFHPPSGCAFAELTRDQKAAISHRGQALARLRDHLAAHPESLAP